MKLQTHQSSVELKQQAQAALFSGRYKEFNALREKHLHARDLLSGFNARRVNFKYFKLEGLDFTNVDNVELAWGLQTRDLTDVKFSDQQLQAFLRKSKIGAFNRFCRDNPDVKVDLRGLDVTNLRMAVMVFKGRDLTGVIGIDLTPGNMENYSLEGTKISNSQLCDMLRAGKVKAFNRYRADNPDAEICLAGLDAQGISLAECNLTNLDLREVKNLEFAQRLNDANLKNAFVRESQFLSILTKNHLNIEEKGARVERTPQTLIDTTTTLRALLQERGKSSATGHTKPLVLPRSQPELPQPELPPVRLSPQLQLVHAFRRG